MSDSRLELDVYQVTTPNGIKSIFAGSTREAKERFQERYGYWPEDSQVVKVQGE